MTWVDDRHVGCSLGDASEHGWCSQKSQLTCQWCGHETCDHPSRATSTGNNEWFEKTLEVLELVVLERVRQVAQYGHNDDLEDGTGPRVEWIPTFIDDAEITQARFRDEYETYERQHGKPTWMHLIREEVAEAFQESDPVRLEEELVQVAALCVSWIESLRKR